MLGRMKGVQTLPCSSCLQETGCSVRQAHFFKIQVHQGTRRCRSILLFQGSRAWEGPLCAPAIAQLQHHVEGTTHTRWQPGTMLLASVAVVGGSTSSSKGTAIQQRDHSLERQQVRREATESRQEAHQSV